MTCPPTARLMLLGFGLCLGLAAVVPAAPARAQSVMESKEGIALQNQIAELRAEVQGLRDQLAKGGQGGGQGGGSSLGGYQTPASGDAAPSDMTAQLLGRVQRMEDELRSMRGRVDEMDNARQRQAEDFNKQIGDLKFEVENGAGAAPGGTPAPGAPGAPAGPRPTPLSPPPGNLAAPTPGAPDDVPPPPPPPPPKRTPEMILQEGNAALARKDYAAAATAAKTVLAAGGPKATDAQFLLARANYGKRDFSAAAVAFDDTYNRSRTGAHAQDALVGLAASLDAINEKRAACQTLDKLAAEFPNPRADLRVPAATLRRDAGCH